MKDQDTLAARHAAFSEIPVLMNQSERVKFLTARLKSKNFTRASRRETLESQIQALFGKALSSVELDETIGGLVAEKIITLSEKGEVAYKI